MSTSHIDSLFTHSHPDIVKRANLSGLLVSTLLLVAGIALFVVTLLLEERSSSVSMGLMVLGTSLVLLALFRFAWKSKQLVYAPTGSVAKMRSCFFDMKDRDKLKAIVQRADFADSDTVKSVGTGVVRMDVMLSEDKKFAAVQLSHFVNYTYNPLLSVQYFTGAQASDVASFLARCRNN